MIELTLPVPPSGNRAARHGRGGHFLPREVRLYRDQVRAIARAAGITPLEGPLWVHWIWYRARRQGDLDNRSKQLLDALNAVAWYDDEQVVEIHAFRADDPQRPRVEVLIGRAA